jgi:hypothetical protein
MTSDNSRVRINKSLLADSAQIIKNMFRLTWAGMTNTKGKCTAIHSPAATKRIRGNNVDLRRLHGA